MGMDWINQLTEAWGQFILARTIDSTWVLLAVLALWFGLRKKVSAQFGYLLFLLVLIKLAVPVQQPLPFLSEPLIAFTGRSPALESIPKLPPAHEPVNHINDTIGNGSTYQAGGMDSPKEPAVPGNETSKVGSANQSGTMDAVNETAESPASSFTGLTAYVTQALKRLLSSLSFLMLAWLGVTLYLTVKLIHSEFHTRRFATNSRRIDPAELPVCWENLLRTARVKRPVRLLCNSSVRSPLVSGILFPTLFLPNDFSRKYTDRQIRWILLHELAHVRRWDPLVKLFQRSIFTVFFFHPAVWIANAMIDRLREFACDDSAILRSDLPLHDCGEGYLGVVFQINKAQIPVPGLIGLFNSKRHVKERLMRILDRDRRLHAGLSVRMIGLLIAVSAVMIPFSGFVTAAEKSDVAQVSSVAGSQESASKRSASVVSSVEAARGTVPKTSSSSAEYRIVKPGCYVWEWDYVTGKGENFELAEFSTVDGDIIVKPQTDPENQNIDVRVKITISKNQNNSAVTEEDILAAYKQVGLHIESPKDDNKKQMAVRYDGLKKRIKGINISVDLLVTMPSKIHVKALAEDGDIIVKEGMRSNAELHSEDGDITAGKGCRSVTALTEDGDIVVDSPDGPVEAVTEDGDITLHNIHRTVSARTEDGDIVASFLSAPSDGAVFTGQDGDIVIQVLGDAKFTVDLQCKDGEIELDRSKFEGTFMKKKAQGNVNGGGGLIKSQTGDGSILFRFQD